MDDTIKQEIAFKINAWRDRSFSNLEKTVNEILTLIPEQNKSHNVLVPSKDLNKFDKLFFEERWKLILSDLNISLIIEYAALKHLRKSTFISDVPPDYARDYIATNEKRLNDLGYKIVHDRDNAKIIISWE